jgi:hypothetical protein
MAEVKMSRGGNKKKCIIIDRLGRNKHNRERERELYHTADSRIIK